MSIKQPHPYYTLVRDDGVDRMNEWFPNSQALDRQQPLTRKPVTHKQYIEFRRRSRVWGPEQRRLFFDQYYIVDEPKMEPTPDSGPGILVTMAATVAQVFRVFVPKVEKPQQAAPAAPPKQPPTFFTR